MKNSKTLTPEEQNLFKETFKGVKPLKQDTVVHQPVKKTQTIMNKKLQQEQVDASFYFSDQYQPLLNSEGPVRYHREDVSSFEVKKLRRGDYVPEFFLDLHGLTQEQAKQEIGALIAACRREHVKCACIMHGYGQNILKRQTPLWLAQHPAILAFHQAPKEFGGDAAILLLVETDEP